MAESSWPWGGTSTGDAVNAPYTDRAWSNLWTYLFAYDRTTQAVLPSALAGFTGNLAVSNPAGTTIRLATGLALVDGRLYRNSANLDFNTSGDGTYYLVLREDVTAQTVRAALLKNTTVTQTSTIWEVSLARIEVVSGVHVVNDQRQYVRDAFSRIGGNATNWNIAGITAYRPLAARTEVGVHSAQAFTGAVATVAGSVSFDRAFAGIPIIYTSLLRGGGDNGSRPYLIIDEVLTTGFSYALHRQVTGTTVTYQIHWMAVGQR